MTTPFIISTELIRRFPFAVNPTRIRDADQEAIAADMLKAARKEGHASRFPINPIHVDAETLRQQRRERVVNILRKYGDLSTRNVAWRANIDPRYTNSALSELCMEGVVKRVRRAGNDQIWGLV